jgi:cell division protein FtsL
LVPRHSPDRPAACARMGQRRFSAHGGLSICRQGGGRKRCSSHDAALWDERLSALPDDALRAAMAASSFGGDVRNAVLVPLLTSLDLSAPTTISVLEHTRLLVTMNQDRYQRPHALLQEHQLAKLQEQPDASRVLREAAHAIAMYHPAAGTRRVVSGCHR